MFKPDTIDLRLNPRSPAATAASPLSGFNTGTATQPAALGAYPIGASFPQYGPRSEGK